MNDFLLYILKSTISISLLYLVFRMLMRKETFFALNRMLLLSAVVCSSLIPLLYLPHIIRPTIQNEWIPPIQDIEITQPAQAVQEETTPTNPQPPVQNQTIQKQDFPRIKLLQNVYLAGILITFLILIHGIVSVLLLFRNAQFRQMDGFRLLILNQEIPPFSFGRFVIISQSDYDTHQQTILAHEQAHIRLNHFYDLALLEAIKIFHWFNPVMYWLIRDMKEIHEFQADRYTLNKGIDAIQYQKLIIQKSVRPQRFALANSFNHCQIKKRITMMNKQKTSKARRWKVATFLPLLALLLMAFGKKTENIPQEQNISTMEILLNPIDSVKHWTEKDFKTMDQITQWVKSGKLPDLDWYSCIIEIDSVSQLHVNSLYEPMKWNKLSTHVQKYLDYDFADENTITHFQKIKINGQDKMMPKNTFILQSDQRTPFEDYQKLIITIGNTILKIRNKYANEIFKSSYSKLNIEQKDEIDMLIPAIAKYLQSPLLAKEMVKDRPHMIIEVTNDGIFVDHCWCVKN